MATRSEATVGGANAASWVIGAIVALCAVLLLKWLAVVALVAVGVFVFVRWARAGDARDDGPVADPVDDDLDVPTVVVPRPAPSPDDCTWCGLADGHRDVRGRLIRPRHAHAP